MLYIERQRVSTTGNNNLINGKKKKKLSYYTTNRKKSQEGKVENDHIYTCFNSLILKKIQLPVTE